MHALRSPCLCATGLLLIASAAHAAGFNARELHDSPDATRATVRVHTAERSPFPIPAAITGKFAEHLGFNIYNGMDAQILRNATFAEYPVASGRMSPDGVTLFHSERERIQGELRRLGARFGWPDSELDGLLAAHRDGLAAFWTRVGEIAVSPDTGPSGGRAQRIEVKASGGGIAQWTWLPLHRTNRFVYEVLARAPQATVLNVTLSVKAAVGADAVLKNFSAESELGVVNDAWQRFTGELELPADTPRDARALFSIVAPAGGQFIVRHAFLRPADHVNGADPDVIRLLKESHLSVLRWPGGNFVSGYHWEDGVGPIEARPTKPNFAWGGVEPNTFGTDEFTAFCRAVGCEPMICVNAGDGTPEEAARWLEYCNGPATSPMGARRAANGHPAPYNVRLWEVGNELWGRWQFNWTTASGYVDRYRNFARAMRTVDTNLPLMACGAPVFWGAEWNRTLIAGLGSALTTTTDHPLIGGDVPPSVEPLDVFRDFMAVPEVLEQKWSALRDAMTAGGVREPRLAVTELQLFAHLGRATDTNAPVRLTPQNLVNPGTLAEALYDVLIYHAAVRLAPFVDMVTQSATVNHGGGLRKERERVYANPCHYAQTAFAAFAGATPVRTEIFSAIDTAPRVLPELRNAAASASASRVDALAAVAPNGDLLLSLVHRGTAPLRVELELPDFAVADRAELRTLTADVPWAANTLEHPEVVKPADSALEVRDQKIAFEFKPFSVARLRVPRLK